MHDCDGMLPLCMLIVSMPSEGLHCVGAREGGVACNISFFQWYNGIVACDSRVKRQFLLLDASEWFRVNEKKSPEYTVNKILVTHLS